MVELMGRLADGLGPELRGVDVEIAVKRHAGTRFAHVCDEVDNVRLRNICTGLPRLRQYNHRVMHAKALPRVRSLNMVGLPKGLRYGLRPLHAPALAPRFKHALHRS